MSKKNTRATRKRLHRHYKVALHLLILGFISMSLATDGAKIADWLFVALGVIVELG